MALGGILGALSLTFMLLTFFSVGSYALPAIAGAVFIPFVIEAGARSAWTVYAAVALLSLFISPDLEAKVLFLSFFGYYPIFKAQLERIKKRPLEWFFKLALFNTAVVLSYFIMLTIFNLKLESFVLGGVKVVFIMLATGNIVFIMYDIALTRLASMYMRVLHPRISRIFGIDRDKY